MAESVSAKFTAEVAKLPLYCMSFFVAKDDVYMPKTKLAYAIDLSVFFNYLIDVFPDRFPYDSIRKIPAQALEQLTSDDISYYLMYLGDYALKNPDGTVSNYKNSPAGKKRKLATLKSFFRYMNVSQKINNDPTVYVDTPKERKKEIVVLNDNEKKRLKDAMETGKGKSARAALFHEHTRYRDLAILLTFLGTGVRISEMTGIHLYDLDFDEQRFLVTRKGGKQEFVYFNKEVLSAITDYLDMERRELIKGKGDPDADGPLFLSNRGTGITADRVEQIIKDAAAAVLPPNLKVTCHTLRKTYGTELYEKFGDILLVQHALGHENSATTTRYYTKFDQNRLKKIVTEK